MKMALDSLFSSLSSHMSCASYCEGIYDPCIIFVVLPNPLIKLSSFSPATMVWAALEHQLNPSPPWFYFFL